MPLKPNVLDRLLLSKSFLDRIRFQPVSAHDRHTLAANIITAHDAAELAIAAVADELACSPANAGKAYLMDYFDPIEKKTSTIVHGRDYLRQLNSVRVQLKHHGLFPDARQWARVGESVYQDVAKWCTDYLGVPFGDLDESALLVDGDVKRLYDEAKECKNRGDFKGTLERISVALSMVFERNAALRGFTAGKPSGDDAIRLSGFAVHANDFLALQEFLPCVESRGERAGVPQWTQSQFGHPGNWRSDTAEFCLRAFLDVAIRIQDARWIPGAITRSALYDQRLEALTDKVEIWTDVLANPPVNAFAGRILGGATRREVVKTLTKGETLKAFVSLATETSGDTAKDAFYGGGVKTGKVLSVMTFGNKPEENFFGRVLASEVKVTCVPKEDIFIKKHFPDLPVIEWEPE